MKTRLLLTILAVLGFALPAGAADNKDQPADAVKTGPTNGRLLTAVKPHVEFLVTPEKKIELRFVDDANKVTAPGAQEIIVILGERVKPTRLTFTKEGDKLVSNAPIPEGNDYPTVVQVREKAGAKAMNIKFNLNLTKCPTCENAEYHCECDHSADDMKGGKVK